ncbi:hypothetical protein D9M70_515610 [compost metagenome]
MLAEIEHIAIGRKNTVAAMMQGPPLLAVRVDPQPFGLQDEEVMGLGGIEHPAFDVGNALADQWRRDAACRLRRQAETLELVDSVARAIADIDDRPCKIEGRDGDDAFAGRSQRAVAMIPGADDAADQGRRMLDHHVEAHRHDVRRSFVAGGHQHDRTRFELTKGPGGRYFLHGKLLVHRPPRS